MNGPAVQLQEFCRITQGGRTRLSGNDFVSEGYPAYGAGGMNGLLATYEFDRPAVVLSAIGARCGKCFYAEGKWHSLANTQLIFPDSDKADARFLWYQLNDERRWHRSGTGQPFIKPADVKTHRVFLPPLPEQRRIAAILDKADALRAKRREALALLDTLTQSIFLDMFGDPATNPKGWRNACLGSLVNEFRYGTSNKAAGNGSPALRIPNVVGGTIDLSDLKLVPVDAADFQRLQLRPGDLLLVRTNGNPDAVGRCAVFDTASVAGSGFEASQFIFASYLIRARVTADRVLPVFIREYLLGAEGRRQLRSRSKTSAGQFNINTKGLAAIPVPLPPIALQRRFAECLAALEGPRRTLIASLVELDALFASLQHRAFRGEL